MWQTRGLALIVLGTVLGWTAYSVGQDSAEKAGGAAPIKLPHFDAVAAATTQMDLSNADKEKLDGLLKDIRAEVIRLAAIKHDYSPGLGDSTHAHVRGLLDEVTKHAGIAIVAAIVLDVKGDNGARQAAYVMLVTRHKGWVVQELPILCQLLDAAADAEATGPLTGSRAWVEPFGFRLRMGEDIAKLCGVKDLIGVDEKDRLSYASLDADPKAWLRAMLQHGMATAKNEGDRAIMAGCLLGIETSVSPPATQPGGR